MNVDRRQFVKGALAAAVAAALPALPDPTPTDNTLVKPETVAKEALKILGNNMTFLRAGDSGHMTLR